MNYCVFNIAQALIIITVAFACNTYNYIRLIVILAHLKKEKTSGGIKLKGIKNVLIL